MTGPWNIHELTALCQRALAAADYAGQNSGRVRSLPDSRTIRYYTTLGLLDPPAEMRGRTAYYARRHVLQITAIKRLQAAGSTLAELQRQLPGTNDNQLTAWAGLPADFWEKLPDTLSTATAKSEAPTPRSESFWQQPPAAAAPAPSVAAVQPDEATLQTGVVVRLSDGIALTLEGAEARNLTPEKLAAIAPLLNTLVERLSASGDNPNAT